MRRSSNFKISLNISDCATNFKNYYSTYLSKRWNYLYGLDVAEQPFLE